MASISSSKLATVLPPVGFNPTRLQSSPILGLPVMGKRACGVRCSMEEKKAETKKIEMVSSMAAAAAAMSAAAGPAMALVDERMSTEGTGLPFGLSNNLLGWILLGVFGLIWSLYTVYTSSLDEDDDSALSL
ncbi:photosystem II reaction center W protein, chloroplastic [Euphorbia lathyris]|uniref:photosystem II reaction center W protein, chloroplastic n=1 Tax=Euphorbia lathyris TaxID=212925 RepID=UPI003313A384